MLGIFLLCHPTSLVSFVLISDLSVDFLLVIVVISKYSMNLRKAQMWIRFLVKLLCRVSVGLHHSYQMLHFDALTDQFRISKLIDFDVFNGHARTRFGWYAGCHGVAPPSINIHRFISQKQQLSVLLRGGKLGGIGWRSGSEIVAADG